MKALRIVGWNENFENNRTRELARMEWVPVKNKHDGDGFCELLDHDNGMAHFGAWVLLAQVASKCAVRGLLRRSDGRPHDAASLARQTHGDKAVFAEAISRLLVIRWLEEVEIEEVTTTPHNPAPSCGEVPEAPRHNPAPSCDVAAPACDQSTMEWNGTEENRTEASAAAPPPARASVREAPKPPQPPLGQDRPDEHDLGSALVVNPDPTATGVTVVRAKTLGDLEAVHPELVVFRDDRDRAARTLTLYGWEAMSHAVQILGPEAKKRDANRRRVTISEVCGWLSEHYELDASDYRRAGMEPPKQTRVGA